MKAPNKIYLEGVYMDNGVLPIGLHYSPSQSDIEYIRKDLLLEWAEGKKKHYMDRQEYDCGWNDLLDELIDKINSL